MVRVASIRDGLQYWSGWLVSGMDCSTGQGGYHQGWIAVLARVVSIRDGLQYWSGWLVSGMDCSTGQGG